MLMLLIGTQREGGKKNLKRASLHKIVAGDNENRVATELKKGESLAQHTVDVSACKDLKCAKTKSKNILNVKEKEIKLSTGNCSLNARVFLLRDFFFR